MKRGAEKNAAKKQAEELEITTAATQNLFRRLNAGDLTEEEARVALGEPSDEEKDEAACRIQAAVSGMSAREEVGCRAELTGEAAEKIQAAVSAAEVRKEVTDQLEASDTTAAEAIQAAMSGAQSRKEVGVQKERADWMVSDMPKLEPEEDAAAEACLQTLPVQRAVAAAPQNITPTLARPIDDLKADTAIDLGRPQNASDRELLHASLEELVVAVCAVGYGQDERVVHNEQIAADLEAASSAFREAASPVECVVCLRRTSRRLLEGRLPMPGYQKDGSAIEAILEADAEERRTLREKKLELALRLDYWRGHARYDYQKHSQVLEMKMNRAQKRQAVKILRLLLVPQTVQGLASRVIGAWNKLVRVETLHGQIIGSGVRLICAVLGDIVRGNKGRALAAWRANRSDGSRDWERRASNLLMDKLNNKMGDLELSKSDELSASHKAHTEAMSKVEAAHKEELQAQETAFEKKIADVRRTSEAKQREWDRLSATKLKDIQAAGQAKLEDIRSSNKVTGQMQIAVEQAQIEQRLVVLRQFAGLKAMSSQLTLMLRGSVQRRISQWHSNTNMTIIKLQEQVKNAMDNVVAMARMAEEVKNDHQQELRELKVNLRTAQEKSYGPQYFAEGNMQAYHPGGAPSFNDPFELSDNLLTRLKTCSVSPKPKSYPVTPSSLVNAQYTSPADENRILGRARKPTQPPARQVVSFSSSNLRHSADTRPRTYHSAPFPGPLVTQMQSIASALCSNATGHSSESRSSTPVHVPQPAYVTTSRAPILELITGPVAAAAPQSQSKTKAQIVDDTHLTSMDALINLKAAGETDESPSIARMFDHRSAHLAHMEDLNKVQAAGETNESPSIARLFELLPS